LHCVVDAIALWPIVNRRRDAEQARRHRRREHRRACSEDALNDRSRSAFDYAKGTKRHVYLDELLAIPSSRIACSISTTPTTPTDAIELE
jgi:hypothetical protein